jgi:signal transduction histidine kinase
MKNIDLEAIEKEREKIVRKVSSYEEDILQLHNKLHKLDVLCEKEKAILGGQPVAVAFNESYDTESYGRKITELKSKVQKLVMENEKLKTASGNDKLMEMEEEMAEVKIKHERLALETKKLREREKEVIEAFKDVIEDLAGGIMHRSRNYLATISGSVQLCLARKKLDDYVREQLELVEENIAEMLSTMNEFLEITKRIEIYSETVDISVLTAGLVKEMKKNTANLNIDFITDLEKSLPVVNGSSKLLKQVLENIIQNSIEAIENTGRIEVKAYHDDNNSSVCICIKDNGKGISEQHINKIFHTYFTTKKNHKGNGLTIAKMVISMFGGTMTLDSKKGKGTKIVICLPA